MEKEEKDKPQKPLGQWLVENVPRGTNLELPDRKSTRLRGYDYSSPGAYFVTIVIHNRLYLLGDVIEGKVRLNDAGEMVQQIWEALAFRFPSIDLDAFIVMPNHVHGIVFLNESVGAPLVGAHSSEIHSITEGAATKRVLPKLGDVVGAHKSITTVKYVEGVKVNERRRFPERLWQRNYYEHVIRDEEELERAREYIFNNTIEWEMDPENPIV